MIIYNDNTNTILDTFEYISQIEMIENGQKQIVFADNKDFLKLKTKLFQAFANSRIEPAFGVSIHDETLKEMKTDKWIKICFNTTLQKSDLPFTALLFKLDYVHGINLIREYNKKYDGRCIYISFEDKQNLHNLF
ncbi:MAG: hypothetical protein IKM43_02735 [Clostridia bacterium]|nr:hypothetical protein [Clostridia bacterium]